MADKIALSDIKLKYATIQEAKSMPGLRLILGANSVPGPWREACKGIFHVKKIPYTPVASAGQDGSQRELTELTAQSSAPVALWNDERPRSTWIEQLFLAERLQPEPALIPANADDRVAMFGISNEICGENGLGWNRRHLLIDSTVSNPKTDPKTREFWRRFGGKYLYSEEGQEIAARNFYRPRSTAVPAALTKQFPKIKLYTIDDSFGGWTKAQKTHFADGGVFDSIYQPQ